MRVAMALSAMVVWAAVGTGSALPVMEEQGLRVDCGTPAPRRRGDRRLDGVRRGHQFAAWACYAEDLGADSNPHVAFQYRLERSDGQVPMYQFQTSPIPGYFEHLDEPHLFGCTPGQSFEGVLTIATPDGFIHEERKHLTTCTSTVEQPVGSCGTTSNLKDGRIRVAFGCGIPAPRLG